MADIKEYVNKKIDFTNSNKSGVEVPDSLITVGATDAYKLLEALNLDWKNIDIPWAKYIERWNSAFPGARAGRIDENVEGEIIDSSPFNADGTNKTKSKYLEALEYEWNNLTNSVDWLKRNYDYLTDNGYIYNENGTDYVGIPNWAVEGKIRESEDIVDILNYLIWRIVNLDYYTAHWDQRNSSKAFFKWAIGWTDDAQISSIGKMYYDAEKYVNKESNKYYISSWNSSSIKLVPTKTNESTSILIDTEIFDWYRNETGRDNAFVGNILFPFIVSNSPGNIILNDTVTFPANTITIEDGSFVNVDNWMQDGVKYYAFKSNINVKGTGNYYTPDIWFKDYYINNAYSKFDPKSKDIIFDVLQKGTTDMSTGEVFSDSADKDGEIAISIKKSNNALRSFSVFSNNIMSHSSISNADKNNEYADIYTWDNSYYINIPFKTSTTPQEGYEISFNLTYDDSYGIHPYFAIKGSNSDALSNNDLILNEDGTFNNFHNDNLGTIEFKNNKYYFMPPVQPVDKDEDKEITVYYAFYYNNVEYSRQLIPILGTFKIRLTARITNRIIFAPSQRTLEHKYNASTNSWPATIIYGNDSVFDDRTELNCINDSGEYPVSYCIRTIEYGEQLDNRLLEALCFDKFIYTYCSNEKDMSVEYLGYMHSSSDVNRNIDFELERIYPDKNNEDFSYSILLNNTVKLGPDYFDNNFYYSEDTPYNYGVQDTVLNNIKYRDKVIEDSDNEYDELSGQYFEDSIYDSDYIKTQNGNEKFNFELLKSTAEYPLQNGIIRNPEDATMYVDADNDYYYLVFKITAPSGSLGGISFTAAKGYYFIRILRKENTVALTFNGDTTSEIKYLDASNNEASFRLMTRIPIYLNRLFTKTGQDELKKMKGKFYWQFYGDNVESDAFQLDPTITALRNDDEEFIKIYNEGDLCRFIDYNDPTPNSYNIDTSFKPENKKLVNFGVAGNEKIQHFNTTSTTTGLSSGAILWVNKLMHATNDTSNPYQNIMSDYVTLLLKLSIGNSEKYLRVSNSTVYSISIYKRPLDIDFQLYVEPEGHERDKTKFLNTGKTLADPYILYKKDFKPGETRINGTSNLDDNFKEKPIFFTSNEFGRGIENTEPEFGDKVLIESDGIVNRLQLSSDIKPVITMNSSAINNTWVINTATYIVPEGFDKNLLGLYFTTQNESSQERFKGAFTIWGNKTNGQNPDLIEFKIAGDEYGVYRGKRLNLYVSVQNQSSVDVESE